MTIFHHNIIAYIIELLKIVLVVTTVESFKINITKLSITFNVISLTSVAVITKYIFSSLSVFLYGIMAVISASLIIKGQNRIKCCLLSYIKICLTDMFITSIVLCFTNINIEVLLINYQTDIIINSINLVLIGIVIILKKLITHIFYNINSCYMKRQILILLIAGGFSCGLYMTPAMCLAGDTKAKVAIGICFSGVIFCILSTIFAKESYKHILRKNELEVISSVVTEQKNYYESVLTKSKEKQRIYHDIMFHIRSMHQLLEADEIDNLNEYFDSLNIKFKNTSIIYDTGNHLINTIITDCTERYKDVKLEITGKVSNNLRISDIDIVTIISNLLENAFYAAEQTSDKIVLMKFGYYNNSIIIKINNSVNVKKEIHNGKLNTDKSDKIIHGFGSVNVHECIENLDGVVDYQCDDDFFRVRIIIPNVL